jgi:hypothetical protein
MFAIIGIIGIQGELHAFFEYINSKQLELMFDLVELEYRLPESASKVCVVSGGLEQT